MGEKNKIVDVSAFPWRVCGTSVKNEFKVKMEARAYRRESENKLITVVH